MITGVCFLLLVAAVPPLGGRLSRLGEIRLRAWWTIILSLVIQVFLIEVFAATLDGVVAATVHLLESAGIIVDSPEFENSAVVDDARLWFLGDIFAVPEGIPFANVFSIGDVILVLGGAVAVHTIAGSRVGTMLSRIDPLRQRSTEPQAVEPVETR